MLDGSVLINASPHRMSLITVEGRGTEQPAARFEDASAFPERGLVVGDVFENLEAQHMIELGIRERQVGEILAAKARIVRPPLWSRIDEVFTPDEVRMPALELSIELCGLFRDVDLLVRPARDQ